MIFKAMPVADVVVEVNRYRRGRIILTTAPGRERFSASSGSAWTRVVHQMSTFSTHTCDSAAGWHHSARLTFLK